MNERLRALSKNKWVIAAGIALVVLIGIRIALPYVVKYYANKSLANMEGYTGHVEDIDMHLWRGAYEIQELEINKRAGKVPVPFFSCTSIDITLDWEAIFDGAIVGDITIMRPQINFVAGPSEKQEQTGEEGDWRQVVDELIPITINKFSVLDGEIHYRDFNSDPKVDIFMDSLYVTAANLTNSKNYTQSLVARVDARGYAMEEAPFTFHLDIDPYADKPTFNMDFELGKLDLTKLNEFTEAYANIDLENGTMELYGEVKSVNGAFEGYIKPLFDSIEVVNFEKDKENILKLAWEAIVGTVTEIFENQPKDRVATRIPLSGNIDDPSVDIWSTIGNIIVNAFIQVFVPGIEQSVKFNE